MADTRPRCPNDGCGKLLVGRGRKNLEKVHAYIGPWQLDNLFDLPDIHYADGGGGGKGGWEVVMSEMMKTRDLDSYSLGQLKDEFKRRGMDWNIKGKAAVAKRLAREAIMNDLDEHVEDEPSWSDRPPLHLHLPAHQKRFLEDELKEEIQQAQDAGKKKGMFPKSMKLGWKMIRHNDDCLHGDQCKSNDCNFPTSKFQCFYCPERECGLCSGLSARQKNYAGNFVCSTCRDAAEEEADPPPLLLSTSTVW